MDEPSPDKQIVVLDKCGKERGAKRIRVLAVLVPMIIAACLILPGMGGPKFWGDEADCALVARNIIKFGYPRSFDGNYLIETEKTVYAPGYIWNQHPWAQHYLCAAGFALLGENNFAARLPFALIAIGGVALAGVTALKLGGARAAFLTGIWLALNTQFLLFARQARYFPLIAPAGLLLILGYMELPKKKGWALFITGGALFFHSNYVPFIPFIGAIYLWTLFRREERETKLKSLLGASLIIVLLTAPWFIGVRAYQRAALVKTFSITRFLHELKEYGSLFNRFVIPAIFLPIAAWLIFRRKRLRTACGLPLLISACTLLFIIPISVTRSLRYTVALFPMMAIIAAFLIDEMFSYRKLLGAIVLALALGTHILDETAIIPSGLVRSALGRGSLGENVYFRSDMDNYFLKREFADYVYEMGRPFKDDPVDRMIDILLVEGKPEDLAITTWSPKRVHFYTKLDTMCNISFIPARGYDRPDNYPDDPTKYRRIWYMRRPRGFDIPEFEIHLAEMRQSADWKVTKRDFDYPNVQAGNVPDLAVRQRVVPGERVELYLIEKTTPSE